jgi:uncharacterized protein (DUF924 family)
MLRSPEEIIEYWLGPMDTSPSDFKKIEEKWYTGSNAVDNEIRELFGHMLSHAESGSLENWKDSDSGSLALVILLDQFSRNLYRGSPAVYKNDSAALSVALSLIESGRYKSLSIPARILLYHPLLHAENESHQEQVVALYEELLTSAGADWQDCITSHLSFARNHCAIVMQFGRFPHRNAILGRASTDEELTHMEKDNRSYGQSKPD